MKFFIDVTVEPTHTQDNPLVTHFNIDKGMITYAGVFFPSGCNGIVHTKLFFQAHQILPRNQESWCHGNNGWWDSIMEFPVVAAPLKCKIVAYSVGAYFGHTITICVEVTPFSLNPRWDELIGGISALLDSLGIEIPVTLKEERKP